MDAAFCAVRERGSQTERGSTSRLEAHAPWLRKLIAEHPDLTLDEIVVATRHGIAGSRSAVWRFFDRQNISVKKRVHARG
jgi:transposase